MHARMHACMNACVLVCMPERVCVLSVCLVCVLSVCACVFSQDAVRRVQDVAERELSDSAIPRRDQRSNSIKLSSDSIDCQSTR